MRAEELRIGNLIKISYRSNRAESVLESSRVDLSDLAAMQDKETNYIFEPIPLTEEWLLRFGLCYDTLYSEDSSNCLYYSKDQKVLHIMDSRDENYSYAVDVQYVHQLQNLVFALTNEELKLK